MFHAATILLLPLLAYLDTQVLVLSTVDQVAAHVLQGANVPGSQGDANAVHGCRIAAMGLLNVLGSSSLRIQNEMCKFEVMLSCDTPLTRAITSRRNRLTARTTIEF